MRKGGGGVKRGGGGVKRGVVLNGGVLNGGGGLLNGWRNCFAICVINSCHCQILNNTKRGKCLFIMMTSSSGNIFRVTGPLCEEFSGFRRIPLTKASDAELWFFFDLRLNKRLSKQSGGWLFETPSRSLWRHCNGEMTLQQFFVTYVVYHVTLLNHTIPVRWPIGVQVMMININWIFPTQNA